MNNISNSSAANNPALSPVDLYRQNGQICAYLNITTHYKNDSSNFNGKFDELVATTDFTFTTSSFLNFILANFFKQLTTAECAYYDYLVKIKSDAYLASYQPDNGIISPIWPWIVLPSSVSILAILLNLSLIIVTAQKISLSKLCNWLIAYDSLCQCVAVVPFVVNLVGVIGNLSPIGYGTCLASLMLSTGSCYASFLAVYFISLERLLIVICPIFMNRVRGPTIKLCSLLVFAICTAFGAIMTLAVFKVWTIINLPYDRWLYCNSGLYSDVLNTPISYILISMAILNYFSIFGFSYWSRFHRSDKADVQNANGTNQQQTEHSPALISLTRRMLRSVLTITLVLFIGWIIGSAARNQVTDFTKYVVNLVVPAFIGDAAKASIAQSNILSWLIGLVTCLFVIASGINAPILIISNFEYRKAYKRTFLTIFTGKKSTVGPLFTTKQPQQQQ